MNEAEKKTILQLLDVLGDRIGADIDDRIANNELLNDKSVSPYISVGLRRGDVVALNNIVRLKEEVLAGL